MIKKILLLMTISVMLLCTSVYAEETKVTDFTVQERNEVTVEDYLISRGIPLKEGFLSQDDALIVKDSNGKEIVTQNKVLSTYDDGSVRWMQVAFLVNLSPEEKQEYTVYKTSKRNWQDLAVAGDNGIYTVDTGKIKLSIDNMGMQKININDYNIFDENGASSYYQAYEDGDTFTTKGDSIELVENGPVYAQFWVNSTYTNGVMRIEQVITVYKNSNKIGCDYRWVSCGGAKASKDRCSSMYEQYNLKSDFSTVEYKEKSKNNSMIDKNGEYPIYSCDWVQAYNPSNNISFTLVSKDVEKFRNMTGRICNGFGNTDSKIIFSPLWYKRGYDWKDGYSRTAHTDIIVANGQDIDKEAILKTQNNTPEVIINPQVYVDGGITKSAKITSAAEAQINAVCWMKGRTNGLKRAGFIPHNINTVGGVFGGSDVPLGENGFNMWYAQMTSGNGTLFDLLVEHENEYIDNGIYEGSVVEGRGAGRYRIDKEANENSNHCFYGEFSHLYISYCMTGQEHYKRAMKEMAEYIYMIGSNTTLSGHNMVTTGAWTGGAAFSTRNMAEIRYAFMIRAMYYSYELFKDEKYLWLGDEIALWVKDTQEENGSWAQGYNQDGSGLYYESMKQVLFKNYIMLYALRGPAEYYRKTGNEALEGSIVKFGDYLLSEMQNDQWMWDPVADTTISEMNEDGARGEAPQQEIMATEMLELAYEITGDEKYFEGMCKYLRYYLGSMQETGTSPQRYNYKGYNQGLASSPILGTTSTLSRMDSTYIKLFEEKQDLAKKLGFDDLVDIYVNGAKHSIEKVSGDYNFIDVTAHIFETDDTKWLYTVNHSGYYSEQVWEKTIEVKTKVDNYIWSDCENIIDNIYETKASRYYEVYEMAMMKLLPIKVSAFTDTVKVTAKEYSSDGIVLNVVGNSGTAELEIHNGDFAVTDGEKYYVSITGGNEKEIAIKADKNGNYVAENGKLTIALTFTDLNFSFEDIQNHWAKNDIEALTEMGLIKGVGANMFAPNGTITKHDFILMAMRVMGYENNEEIMAKAVELGMADENENLDVAVKRDEMADICMKVLEASRDMSQMPVESVKYDICGEIADDAEAVKADLDSITLDDYAPTKENLSLPVEGMYGSTISWASSDEAIISATGVINRPEIGKGTTVTLTATATRNGASEKKEFALEVPDKSNISIIATHPIASSLIQAQSAGAEFDFTFDAVPHGKGVDCVFSLADSSGTYAAFTDIPMLIRFNTGGKIDAYNKNVYAAVENIEYIPNETYKFRVTGKCGTKLYSVTVTAPDGKEYVIADNYEFRASAQNASKIDYISVDEPDGLAEIVRHDLAIDEPLQGGGSKNAEEYFGVSKQDVEVPSKEYISGNPEIVDDNGKIINIPSRTTTVEFFKTPDELDLFDDFGNVDGNYKLSVIKGQIVDLLSGDNGKYNPTATSTRAEAAVLIRRLNDLKKAGKIL